MKRTLVFLLMMLFLSNSTVYADWVSVTHPILAPYGHLRMFTSLLPMKDGL